MNFQKLLIFCFIISYILFCHIVWNGCYNIYSTTEDEMYSLLYSKKAKYINEKIDIKTHKKFQDLEKLYAKSTPCPILPRPLKSIFHMNWFRKSTELIPISIQLYSMFHTKTTIIGFILLCSAIFTLIEWSYLIYIIFMLLWNGFLKPLFKILNIIVSFYLIVKFIVIFLPYTKKFISQESYIYISSIFYGFYQILTKTSKELGNLLNGLIQESSK